MTRPPAWSPRSSVAAAVAPLLVASTLSTMLILSPANVILAHNIQFLDYEWRVLRPFWAAFGLATLGLAPLVARSLRHPAGRARALRVVAAITAALVVLQERYSLAEHMPLRAAETLAALAAVGVGALLWRLRPAVLVLVLSLLSPLTLLEAYRSIHIVGYARAQAAPDDARAGSAPTPSGPDIYHFVFDELSLVPVLGPDGRLDARIVPSFAAFAEGALFFPEATSNYSETVYSIASTLRSELILPSRDNDHYRSFRHAVQGRSLLRALKARGYRVEVYGQHIPYGKLLGGLTDSVLTDDGMIALSGQRSRALYAYASRVFGALAGRAVQRLLGARVRAGDEDVPINGVKLLDAVTARVARRADRPTYHFVHVLLPHHPFVYAADGRVRPDLSSMRYEDYISQIRYTDALFGRFLAALAARGAYDESLVVVHADHGLRYPFPELGVEIPADLRDSSVALMYAVPASLDMLARVPVIVKTPNQVQGSVHREPVTLLDVYPTIMEVVGGTPEGVRGVSLLSPRRPAPHRAARPFLSSTRRGRQLHRWDEYRVHVRDAGGEGWRDMGQAAFERVFRPVDFSRPEPLVR